MIRKITFFVDARDIFLLQDEEVLLTWNKKAKAVVKIYYFCLINKPLSC